MIQWHMIFWTIACVSAFLFYYFSNHRKNPEFADQLHCPSGIMLNNKLVFSVLMCCFSGAALFATGIKAYKDNNHIGIACSLVMYVSSIILVQFDIKDHKTIHFASLGIYMISTTAVFAVVDIGPPFLMLLYYASTALFVSILLLNFLFMDCTPPFMTLQALAEILWLSVMAVNACGTVP